ncbi:unnamed protein product [Phytomonas sp. Hart1]|nr:unnamed protein product [Phytomonas sp. Hart1]|eukprot:CCW66614.1 unnamed protein product [Phytomonas sp. isolate Hart1]
MSARMQFPLSQRRHTNVAVVRYTQKGVRLEIACYKNKVVSYRSGTEDRLDEVLQVDRIFSNVARGHVASEKDIQTVFGPNLSNKEAIKYMLIHGELQVAQHERTAEVDEMFKDIALIISQKCLNSNTQRPFPCFVIEQALKEIGVGVKLDQPVKKQALSLIHQLVESQIIPISRANMKLRCSTKTAAAMEKLRAWCDAHNAQIVEEVVKPAPAEMESSTDENASGEIYSALVLIQPNFYGAIEGFIKRELPTGSTVHVVEASVIVAGECDGANFMAASKALSSAVSTACSGIEVNSRPHGNYQSSKSFDDASNDFQKADKDTGAKLKHGKGNKGTKMKHGKNVAPDEKLEANFHKDKMTRILIKPDANEHDKMVGDLQMKTSCGVNSSTGENEEGDKIVHDEEHAKNFGTVRDELVVQLQQLGLDPVVDLTANDKEDNRRNKGKKNPNKRKTNKNDSNTNSKKNSSMPIQEENIDSDEELEGNRKQRKKNTQKKSDNGMENDFDEENFDYWEEI